MEREAAGSALMGQEPASPVLEVRARQVTLAVVRVLRADPEALRGALEAKVQEAPKMLDGVPVALDLTPVLREDDDQAVLESLIDAARGAGPVPVAGIVPGEWQEALRRAGLTVLPPEEAGRGAEGGNGRRRAAPALGVRVVETPVRSGQQIYAREASLLVLGSVGAGAEILADGHVCVYGALRGRALAGVQGDRDARIVASQMEAELVSVAGQYQISEHLDSTVHGIAAQVRLDEDEQLRIEAL